ncbi:MAG TPA: methyltransferase [Candidatus Limnocylindrales bacterium]|nr:methyltransferase [Candidatus Limnocylindrales bacterium]
MPGNLDPSPIITLAGAFTASKTLFSAIEIGVFRELAGGPLDGETLRQRLSLHPRSSADFLDALVAIGVLDKNDGRYANTEAGAAFLDPSKPTYIGGFLEMAGARLYPFWGSLTEALRTGEPQNETKTGGDLFPVLYNDPARLKQFAQAMTGVSMGAAEAIAEKFPWKSYRAFVDIGCAQGCVPVQVALAHPHMTGGGFDLAQMRPIFEEYVASAGLSRRLTFTDGDFFNDPLPNADVLAMGRILHDWDLEQKKFLLAKAYAALPDGGALIVYESLIDDERRVNMFGLLMSLNMLIETRGGFDFTGADCMRWMKEAGFRETRVEHLNGPDSMVVGIK